MRWATSAYGSRWKYGGPSAGCTTSRATALPRCSTRHGAGERDAVLRCSASAATRWCLGAEANSARRRGRGTEPSTGATRNKDARAAPAQHRRPIQRVLLKLIESPLLRVLAVVILVAAGIRLVFELLEPVWPLLAAVLVVFALFQAVRWCRDRW